MVKVVLPDESELELPDGATGLDAARAIGPKLAEQAVLLRSNGAVRDLRLPVSDGERIQILTTRDKDDPDALYVLRHSAAHLLAEAARRLFPGTKVAIGPPIENGFYYDFEFPEPVTEADLQRLEDEVKREIQEGRVWEREEIARDDARKRFEKEGEPYKVELVDTAEGDISLYKQGDFIDLCRGPHLQDAKPIKAVKLLSLAGAYWRGDETKPQLTRVYGTAFYDPKDLEDYLHRTRGGEDAATTGGSGKDLDLVRLLDELSPGCPFWHPRGMVIWNVARVDFGSARTPSRGYHEVQHPAPLRRPTSGDLRPLGEVPGQHVPARAVEGRDLGLKPMNCPGHCLLYSLLDPQPTVICRSAFAEAGNAAPERARPASCTASFACATSSQDDAHIYCTHEQIQDELLALPRLRRTTSTTSSAGSMRVELSLAARQQAGRGRGVGLRRGGAPQGARTQGLDYVETPGDGAFYGPKIDLHMNDSSAAAGRSGRSARRCRCRTLRARLRGRRQPPSTRRR